MLARRRGWTTGAAAALILVGLMLFAPEARAARYTVAQCGFGVPHDASFYDSTGGYAFRHDAYCVAPAGQDPVAGTHVSAVGRSVPSAGPQQYARWRWPAPPGTGIVAVRGAWWSSVRDGFEHRLGSGAGDGGFTQFTSRSETDTTPRPFVAGFSQPKALFESRLLCVRLNNRCSLEQTTYAAVRTLTLTLDDPSAPTSSLGGDVLAGGWLRGDRSLSATSSDLGSGMRVGETFVDGHRVANSEHACAVVMQGGEWRGTRMRPCELRRDLNHQISTRSLTDGPHSLVHCSEDFAGNRGCGPARQLLVDNNPPAAPRALAVVGGDGWRRDNAFALSWVNPDQGAASPIAAAGYRITGPGGYDSGPRYASGEGISGLGPLTLPAPGAYAVRVWLRDAAGNENPSADAGANLRFDNLPPTVAFQNTEDSDDPDAIRASTADELSGVADGLISYRRLGSGGWNELPTSLRRTSAGPELVARFPSTRVRPGRYELTATAIDAAGNSAATGRRASGSPMVLEAPLRRRVLLRAALESGSRQGREIRVPFGSSARVVGRLVDENGVAVADHEVQVAVRPARGALASAALTTLRTGERGFFRAPLAAGPSRSVEVRFPGSGRLAATTSGQMTLAVRAGVDLALSSARLRTGELLRLTGTVRRGGAVIPARGKLVEIQYFEREARRWRPVLVVRSGSGGRFRARYRFRYISEPSRIRLRAIAPPESGWPYALGASLPASVVVRPGPNRSG